MPLPDHEPLPTIIRVRVINPHAPHAGDEGWVVDVGKTDGRLVWLDVRFVEGEKPVRYARDEVQLCEV